VGLSIRARGFLVSDGVAFGGRPRVGLRFEPVGDVPAIEPLRRDTRVIPLEVVEELEVPLRGEFGTILLAPLEERLEQIHDEGFVRGHRHGFSPGRRLRVSLEGGEGVVDLLGPVPQAGLLVFPGFPGTFGVWSEDVAVASQNHGVAFFGIAARPLSFTMIADTLAQHLQEGYHEGYQKGFEPILETT